MEERRTKLREMRKYRGISQKQLAELAGVTAPGVSVLEKKGIYDTRMAARYAKVLNCNPIFLLEGLSNG